MKKQDSKISRREFIAITSALAAGASLGMPEFALAKATDKAQESAKKSPKLPRKTKKPNILFIFTDQERYFSKLPSAHPLPAHQRLARTGVTFTQHQISATMCTSSRSIMLTGLQTADTKMFDNTDAPYIKDMSTKIPTMGHMLRKAGYYTAYKGKWHLSRDFEEASYGAEAAKKMEEYGFSDFSSPGDRAAHALGGYTIDSSIAASTISWLRERGNTLNEEGKPWSLTVSLVNPHDIMYFNADALGESVQDTGKLLMPAARAPQNKLYNKDWQQPVPASLKQALNQTGRPSAHAEFDKAWGYCLGRIPLEKDNWNRFSNFYLNSMQSVDSHLNSILNELDNLGLTDNTVVVFTADHGEAGGHHGLRGKGPFAYKETMNVPLYVVHPDVKGGASCNALTSHIDLVPSVLGMAGVSLEELAQHAGRKLPGKDFSKVLHNPQAASIHTVRDKTLFAYSAISTNDADIIRIVAEAKAAGKNPKLAVLQAKYLPDMKKRGSLRSVFDGRHKFTRYFAPTQRNSPKTIEELFAQNDVELYDLKNDPSEMNNLAVDRNTNSKLIEEMSAKLELAIADEIGIDDGREMPNIPGIDWSIDTFDL
jgi:arylsulfatase A-like enzyme